MMSCRMLCFKNSMTAPRWAAVKAALFSNTNALSGVMSAVAAMSSSPVFRYKVASHQQMRLY